MINNKNDFLKGLKVETNQPNEPKSLAYNRDVYTCLKLMGDTGRIQSFLSQASQREIDGKKVSMNMSRNYFYSINEQLGSAEYSFRKGKIGKSEFNNEINRICESQNLDFEYLMGIIEKINILEKQPDQDASIKFAQEIEANIVEEHEKRMNVEIENIHE